MTNDLFKPKYNEKQKNEYFDKRIKMKEEELKREAKARNHEGWESKEIWSKLNQFSEILRKEIANDIIVGKMELTPSVKVQIREHIAKTGKTLQVSSNVSYDLPSYIRTHQEFMNHVVKTEGMFSTIFPQLRVIEEKKNNKCVFYPKNKAWIAKGQDGVYRYFTRREGGRHASFSLFDMMEVNQGKGTGTVAGINNARKEVARVLNAQYYGLKFEKETQDKYINNIEMIENEADLKRDYPSLYKMVGKQLYILEKLHTIALTSVIDKKTAIKKEAVFFASTRSLQEFFNTKSHTTFAKAINLFTTLNLLNKHDSTEIDKDSDLYATALQIRSHNEHFNLINFLSLPFYNDKLLARAERIAKKLVKGKITNMDKITEKTLEAVLGKKEAEKVYGKETNINKMTEDELYELAKKNAFYPDLEDLEDVE